MQFEHSMGTFNLNLKSTPKQRSQYCFSTYIVPGPSLFISSISSLIKMAFQYILSVIESAITSIDRVENTDNISSLVLRLDYLNRVIVGGFPDPIVSSLGEVLSILREKEMEPEWEISSTDMEPIRRRGRPSFDVKEEQLSFLVENDFKVPEISLMLGVSTRTVERRLSSFGISISGKLEDSVVSLYWCTLSVALLSISTIIRFDYQRLFGKGAHAPPWKSSLPNYIRAPAIETLRLK